MLHLVRLAVGIGAERAALQQQQEERQQQQQGEWMSTKGRGQQLLGC
jgi:hypothetical protein